MTELTGGNVRRTLRTMDAYERRAVLVSIDRHAKRDHAEGDTSPWTAVLEALVQDIYLAEAEERLLAEAIDAVGDVDGR